MSHSIRPSIIAQRSISLLTGQPRKQVQRYSAIDPSKVVRPVGIGSAHVHAASVLAQQARILTTAHVDGRGRVWSTDGGGLRPMSSALDFAGAFDDIRKGEF